MTLEPFTAAYRPQVKALYKAAFPKNERKPFRMLLGLCRRGKAEIYLLMDGGFSGLMIGAEKDGLFFLDYFAVSPDKRGAGAGSEALRLLREKKERIVLEIEAPDERAENAAQREARKRFYLKNGFTDSGIRVRVYGCEMELLTAGGARFCEYAALYRKLLPFFGALVKPKLLT